MPQIAAVTSNNEQLVDQILKHCLLHDGDLTDSGRMITWYDGQVTTAAATESLT